MSTPYSANPELVKMKQDIADRTFRVKVIGAMVTGILAVAAIATLFFVPGAGAMAASSGISASTAVTGVLAVGGALASFITLKEVKRLEIDNQYLTSYMQGKNYWGEGYREEVAEHGYALSSPLLQAAPPPPVRLNNPSR